jgi:hypothetical protein
MPQDRSPAEVVNTIRQSIEVSPRGERRMLAHRFKELFGYQVLNEPRRKQIEELLEKEGIVVRPSLAEAGRNEWLRLSIPELPVRQGTHPDPPLTAEQLDYLTSVHPETEREVEMHFVSPLFTQALGYTHHQEAAGFPVTANRGGKPQHVEADLIYFDSEVHDLETGHPLILVECKRPGGLLDRAVPQARDYALWVRPAYYVITDARSVSVYDYQGAIGPDLKVLEFGQGELADSLSDLYSYLNPVAAMKTRQRKIDRVRPAR